MSYVTNIMILGSLADSEIKTIEEILQETDSTSKYELKNVGNNSVGDKSLESEVYLLAFNYFNIKKFVNFFNKNIVRETDSHIQIFIKEHNDDYWYDVTETTW